MPNAQQASRRMRSQSSARVFKKDDSARRWSRQWEMRARARVQRWELLAYKNGRSFEKLKKKCFRNVVRGRELPRELLTSLNDISSTCWRGENGLRVFRITNSSFFRLSEVAASHLLLKGESLGQVEENIYGPVLKRRYLSDFLTDLNKSNAIFSLETVSSFHLLGPLSQEVCFKVKTASEVGRR